MIIAAPVAQGDHVRKGTVLVVLEAMKMEHAVRAAEDVVVRELLVSEGERAWPSGDWGSWPMQGGVEAAFRAQLDTITDPQTRAAMIDRIQKQLVSIGSPFRTAEKFGVQDIIDPRDSRAILCEWVEDAYAVLPEQVGRPSFGTRP